MIMDVECFSKQVYKVMPPLQQGAVSLQLLHQAMDACVVYQAFHNRWAGVRSCMDWAWKRVCNPERKEDEPKYGHEVRVFFLKIYNNVTSSMLF